MGYENITFRQVKTKSPVPALRLEVEFENRDYLLRLAYAAKRNGLIGGFTIDERRATYEWKGQPVTKPVFVLSTTIPYSSYSRARLAYEYFQDGIGKKWDVPVIHLDSTVKINPVFERWLEQEADVQEHGRAGVWTYTPNSPHYINLWDGDPDAYLPHLPFMDDTEYRMPTKKDWQRPELPFPITDEELSDISDLWVWCMDRNEVYNPHWATLVACRNLRGLILPEESPVVVFGGATHEDFTGRFLKEKGSVKQTGKGWKQAKTN